MSEHARPIRYWAGGAAAALVVGVGGFLAVTSTGSHSAAATSASFNQSGAPPGTGGEGPTGPSGTSGSADGQVATPPAAGSSSSGSPAAGGTNPEAPAFGGRGQGRPGGDGTFGTLKSVSGTTLTVTAPSPSGSSRSGSSAPGSSASGSSAPATRTVTDETTSATTFAKIAAATVSDVQVGDNVRVMGATSGPTVTAQRIDDLGATPPTTEPVQPGAPGQPGRHGVQGSITSTSPLTLKEADGTTVRVTTSSSTDITKHQTITISGLTVGDQIAATGTTATDGTVTATDVVDLGAGAAGVPGGFGDGPDGTPPGGGPPRGGAQGGAAWDATAA
jgi:hypothetical protein